MGEFEDAILDVVRTAYAEEEEAVQALIDRACESTVLEELLAFLPYVGPLLDSSCIAPDPPRRALLLPRADAVIRRIETGTGFPLDEETKAGVREDVLAIWGW
jgi:hypothetical protein